MYSNRFIGVLRYKFLMSIVKNFAPGEDRILLSSSLRERRWTIGVPQSLGYTIRFPPTVRRVR